MKNQGGHAPVVAGLRVGKSSAYQVIERSSMPTTLSMDRVSSALPERRNSPRIKFDCPVRWNTGTRQQIGWACNVSESGAAFTAHIPQIPLPGDKVHVVFELDSVCEWLVDDQAEVVRCEPLNDKLCQVAVRLSEMQAN